MFYLIALSSIIKIIPRPLCVSELPTVRNLPHSAPWSRLTNLTFNQLLPLLLRCMDLPDPELKANVMEMILTIAEADDSEVASEIIERNAPRIVEGLLRGLDKSKGSNEVSSMSHSSARDRSAEPVCRQRSRVAALRTLAVFPDAVRYDLLHPIKPTVLKELGKAIDDKRREVRKEAVDTRAKWCALFSTCVLRRLLVLPLD